MRRTIHALFIGLAVLLASSATAQDAALVAAAQAEGSLEYYANITAVDPVLAAFAEEYGVAANYTRISTEGFAATLLTEYQAGRQLASVLQAPLPLLEILKEFGLLQPYESPVAAGYPDWSRDPDGMIQQFGIEYVALIYNTELVAAEDVPTSYMDLTDPKWAGKIVMANPASHATTIQWLVGLKDHNVFGSEDAWWEFVRGLAANRPMLVGSFGPTPGPISSGEMHIGISMPKYIVTLAPAPLDWARVSEPMFGTPRGIALAAGAPAPNAGKLFIDYWLGAESSSILAEDVGEYVLAPGVYPPIDGIDDATVLPLASMTDEEISEWGERFADIFR
ncbi:MAG: extracellular solute-binding protein [Trueperaceae bacterium]|nr:extracellular solute-binding protein [Trueperaceae bacterium]